MQGLPGRIALVGSGEYLPVMQEMEGHLLQGRPARYVQLATAAAPEGDESLRHWHDLGAQAAHRLQVEQVVIDVRTREDAEDEDWASLIDGAGLIYLSGGNPNHLTRTLAGTRVWQAIVDAWRAGASLAGCSAGAMALAGNIVDFRHPRGRALPGLGIVPEVRVLPHFDRLARWIPDTALRAAFRGPRLVVGVDEDTALVGEPSDSETWAFEVWGRQSAWTVTAEERKRIDGPIHMKVATD